MQLHRAARIFGRGDLSTGSGKARPDKKGFDIEESSSMQCVHRTRTGLQKNRQFPARKSWRQISSVRRLTDSRAPANAGIQAPLPAVLDLALSFSRKELHHDAPLPEHIRKALETVTLDENSRSGFHRRTNARTAQPAVLDLALSFSKKELHHERATA